MAQKCYLIIGNGFDLAHDAPTSFVDFSNWLLEDYVKRFFRIIKNNESKDFLTQEMINKFGNRKYQRNSHMHTNDLFHPCFDAILNDDHDTVVNLLNTHPNLFKRFFKDQFIANLYSERKLHWFAIENKYYNFLCDYSNKENRKATIHNLNSQLDFLKIKLRQYLKSIEFKKHNGIEAFVGRTFRNYSEMTVINFNYTNTINLYSADIFQNDILHFDQINIHGSLTNENEVFGYGNDLNQEYQRLKELEEDYVLEHFKTVNYIMDKNYTRFINNINQRKDFDVFVIGHSLGLTDKTLLQEVFDHHSCSKIHLLKRLDYEQNIVEQKKAFKTNVMAITRIMEKESDVRRKVSNYKESLTFPLKV